MSDIQEYPLALYQGGDLASAVFVVNDAEEEKLARAQGFVRHGHKVEKAAGEGDLTAAQLKEELTKRNVEFKGNASRDVLQGLYDEALAKEKAAGEGDA